MKNVLAALVIFSLISGCSNNSILRKNSENELITGMDDHRSNSLLNEIVVNIIQNRNGIAYLPNENIPFTGKYRDNFSSGKKKIERNYKDGKKNGLSTGWYENDQKHDESFYKDNELNGLSRDWHENGQKRSKANFKDGKVNGLFITWYENGQKQSESNYEDGKENGLSTNWYQNGFKKSETNFINGERNGLTTGWYENGQKEYEVNAIDDELNGLFIAWHENGQKKGETYIKPKIADDHYNEVTEYTCKNKIAKHVIQKILLNCLGSSRFRGVASICSIMIFVCQ